MTVLFKNIYQPSQIESEDLTTRVINNVYNIVNIVALGQDLLGEYR